MSVSASLAKLIDATRSAKTLRAELARANRDEVLAEIKKSRDLAMKESDPDEQKTRLGCLATLLGEFDGADTVDLLIDLLDTIRAANAERGAPRTMMRADSGR